MYKKGLIEAFSEKLFNFMLFSFGYLVLFHPTPLRLHTFVAMHSIKAGFHFGEFGRATKRWAIRACAARNPS